jgi:hypothetical protein
MRYIIIVFLFLSGISVIAQDFKGEALLTPVDSDAFYRLGLDPALSKYLNEEFSNIRIIDKDNREVPYLLGTESPVYNTTNFKPYEIVEKKQQKNCCTTLILRNPDSNPINNINLFIKNAEVTKVASILGSDDKENWFALKERFVINSLDNKNQTSEIKIVDFPLSNYSYYQLQIEDSTSSPLNILRAGYYEVSTEEGKYYKLTPRIEKSDSLKQKQTYVQIDFEVPQVVDKLQIEMTGAPHFLRRATLMIEKVRVRKGKTQHYYETLHVLELSSKQPSVIELPGMKAKKLLLAVENDDNPPLDVKSIDALQLNRYLTAWLKKGEKYIVKIGDKKLEAPVYDLGFFKDNIPQNPTVVSVGSITWNEKIDEQSSPTIFTNSIIIWSAIIGVIVVLGVMAIRMINETSKEKKP